MFLDVGIEYTVQLNESSLISPHKAELVDKRAMEFESPKLIWSHFSYIWPHLAGRRLFFLSLKEHINLNRGAHPVSPNFNTFQDHVHETKLATLSVLDFSLAVSSLPQFCHNVIDHLTAGFCSLATAASSRKSPSCTPICLCTVRPDQCFATTWRPLCTTMTIFPAAGLYIPCS
jgi:hypothetical protein